MADSAYSMHLGEADAERLELLIVSGANTQFARGNCGRHPGICSEMSSDFSHGQPASERASSTGLGRASRCSPCGIGE
jgi:hypothetical protein